MYNVEKNIIRLKEELALDWHNEDLLKLALTHGSYAYENKPLEQEDNQRLEFLGDAVLELVVSDYLYRTYPANSEGELTKLRAAVVCEPSLTRIARQLKLGECLFMGRGEERSGGRNRPSILADAFEALLGAIYLDQGLAQASKTALNYLKPVIEDVLEGRFERDYKTELQEIIQKKNPLPINYLILKEEGPDHEKIFTAGVFYNGREIGRGIGRSKKEAEQSAARKALQNMGY